MYTYLGDFPTGATIFFPFETFNSSGASVTITGLAVTDIEVYKGASMTQRASDAGYALVDTDGIDLDGVTGIHGFTIDTSDNTDAGFYAAGNDYTVVVASITVDSQTCNKIAGRFSIDNRGILRPTTAGRTLDVTAAGEAGLDFNNVAIPDGPVPALGIVEGGTAQSATSTTLVGRAAGAVADDAFNGCVLQVFGSTQGYWQTVLISDTTLSTDTFTVAAWPSATPSGTITYRIFGTPAGSTPLDAAGIRSAVGLASANLDTQLSGIQSDTNDIQTRLPAALVSGRMDASVGAMAANVMTAAAAAADLTTELQSGLATAAALDAVDNFLDTEIAAILALLDDPRGEPGQGTPPVNPDLATKIDYLYKAWRNRKTQTATEFALYADDGTTKDHEAAVSSDGTTLVIGEMATGA